MRKSTAARLALVFALAVPSSTALAPATMAAGAVDPLAIVMANDAHPRILSSDRASPQKTAIDSYLSAFDEQREGLTSARGLAESPNSLSQEGYAHRELFAKSGLTIIESSTNIESSLSITHGALSTNVEATISTQVKSVDSEGQIINSSWTDLQRFKLVEVDNAFQVASVEIVDPYAVESADVVDEEIAPTEEDISLLGSGEELPQISLKSQPAISTSKFYNYATTYTTGRFAAIAQGNPDYSNTGNNCANFASQVLRAAGWELKSGVNTHDTNNWHYNLPGPGGATTTWTQARTLYYYARTKQGWSTCNYVESARKGDLIFVDWDPNGVPDGSNDHVMVVVGATSSSPAQPLISQKSPNRSSLP